MVDKPKKRKKKTSDVSAVNDSAITSITQTEQNCVKGDVKKSSTRIQIQCYGNVPKRGTAVAAGWDVNPISVKMIAHNGWEVECRTNTEITAACQKLRKMDKRS